LERAGTFRSINDPTPAALFRWGAPAASGSGVNAFALFVLNNGAAVNLNSYATLDMRVAPDCQQHTGTGGNNFCFNVTAQGGGTGVQNVGVTLVDSSNRMSKTLPLSSFTETRQAVGVQFPGQSAGQFQQNPLFHALFSSARIPMASFKTAGFNMAAVKYVRIDASKPTGGLFFGDIWAVSVARTAVQDAVPEGDEMVVSSVDETQVASADDGADSVPARVMPASDSVVPAKDGPDTDGPAPQADAAMSGPAPAADSGSSIVSVERTTLKAKTGVTSDDADAAPTRDVAAIAFTIATREQIVEGDAFMLIKLGNALIPARRFVTGRENETPSVIKLVVPADAVNAAADGATFAVAAGGKVYHFGPLPKSAIR
jgi:hypothetical protein